MLLNTAVRQFIPVAIYLVFTLGLLGVLVFLSTKFGRKTRDPLKDTPYECGRPPLGSTKQRFSVRFYLVAVLFILFDIEAVFLYPWAVNVRGLGILGLVEVALFVAILGLGLAYAWRKGALEWD
ncbi:MAG: NADH-quinone oxidoreductase subunit A [Planctomycetota bacterium]